MSDRWFYVDGGRQHGPFSVEQLTELAASGEVQPATFVWKEGMGCWKPANAINDLASLRFSDTPAPKKTSPIGDHVLSAFGSFGKVVAVTIGLIVFAVFFLFLIRLQDPKAWDNPIPSGEGGNSTPSPRLTPQEIKARINFGMTTEQVKGVLGDPNHKQQMNMPGDTTEFWYYGSTQIGFINNKVVSVNIY